MWLGADLLGDAPAVDPSSGANFWTFLCILAFLLLGSGGILRVRYRRRHPAEIEPEPVARKVVSAAEPLLKRRIKDLEAENAELERDSHAKQVRIETYIRDLATCSAERAALQRQLDALTRRPRPGEANDG